MYLVRGFAAHSDRSGLNTLAVIAILATAAVSGILAWGWKGFSVFLGPAVAQPMIPFEIGSGSAVLLGLGLMAALGGLALGFYQKAQSSRGSRIKASELQGRNRLYLLMHNKWYIYEVCDAFVVRPILKTAHWLWKTVDVIIIERAVVGFATSMIRFAHWLWYAVDVRGLSRLVNGMGQATFALARWLWKSVDIRLLGGAVDGMARSTLRTASWLWRWADIRGIERFLGGIGRKNDAAGRATRELEPSLLQHQLLGMIFFLILALVVFLIGFL